MGERDIIQSLDEKSRETGVNSQPIVRDYLMGIAASASNQVFQGEARSADDVPVIIGGIALRKGYFINFPRYTTDIDYSTRRDFFERRSETEDQYYEARVRDIGALTRDRVNSVYGSTAMPLDPIVYDVERRHIRDVGQLGALRAHLRFPKIFKYQDIRMKFETNVTRQKDEMTSPQEVPVLHAYPDANELKLETIIVEDVRKIHSDKVSAFLRRLSESSNMVKTSRMKDIFDIWYISQVYPNDMLEKLFSADLQKQKNEGRNTSELQRVMDMVKDDSDRFLQWLVELVKLNVKGLDHKGDDEIIRRMVLGLIPRYHFPSAKVLVENLAFEVSRIKIGNTA